jgi:hypothetical protein
MTVAEGLSPRSESQRGSRVAERRLNFRHSLLVGLAFGQNG